MTGLREWPRDRIGIGLGGVGLVVGLAISRQPALGAAAILAAAIGIVGVVYPAVLVAIMWTSMLLDKMGITGMAVGDFPVTLSKLSVVASAGAWVLHAALRGVPFVRWHPVLTAMLGLVAATGVTMAWSNSVEEGRFQFAGLAMMTVLVALVYAALAESELQPLYRFLGVAFVGALALPLVGLGGVGEGDRASGTMGDPNEWATQILLLTPLLLGGLAGDRHPLARPLRVALLVLAPLAISLSGSRSALVVGILVAPASLWLLRRQPGELAACGVGAALVAPFVMDAGVALNRLAALWTTLQGGASAADASFTERSELFRQGKQLFLDHWFIGAGPGNFARATGFVSQSGSLRPAHNTYLEIASEQGLVGLVPTAILGLVVAGTLRTAWLQANRTDDRERIAGVAIGLGALALMAATLGLLTFSMAWLVLGFGLAVVYQAGVPRALAS